MFIKSLRGGTTSLHLDRTRCFQSLIFMLLWTCDIIQTKLSTSLSEETKTLQLEGSKSVKKVITWHTRHFISVCDDSLCVCVCVCRSLFGSVKTWAGAHTHTHTHITEEDVCMCYSEEASNHKLSTFKWNSLIHRTRQENAACCHNWETPDRYFGGFFCYPKLT